MADLDFDVDNISSESELERAKAYYQNQPPELPKQQIEANRILQDRFLSADRQVEEDQRVQRIENQGPTDAQLMDEKLRAQSQSGEANKREMEENSRDARSASEKESEELALHGEDVGKRREEFERKNREDQERSISNASANDTGPDTAQPQVTGSEAAESVLASEFGGQIDGHAKERAENSTQNNETVQGSNNPPGVFTTKAAQDNADQVNANDKDQPSVLSEAQLNKEVKPEAGDQRTGTSDQESAPPDAGIK